MTHEEKAVKSFTDGANCAQAVVLAYADELDMDEKTAARLAAKFAGKENGQEENADSQEENS